MRTLVSLQDTLGEHTQSFHNWASLTYRFNISPDASKWTRTIAFLGAIVIVSRVVKLVKGIKVRCGLENEAYVSEQEDRALIMTTGCQFTPRFLYPICAAFDSR